MNERLRIQRKREQATTFPSIQSDTPQRNTTPFEQGVQEVPSLVHEVLSSSSQALEADTQNFMEPRFGHDFSKVRIHTDEKAVESAQAVNALAYTVGQDVVFGQGQYTPATSDGRKLLAHELTHVVQQGSFARERPMRIGESGNIAEQEANAVSSAVTLPAMISSIKIAQSSLPAQIQRTPNDEAQTQSATPPMPQQTQVTVQPPPEQHLSSGQVQALNQQHPPVNVQVGGSTPSNQQQQATPPQQQATPPPQSPTQQGTGQDWNWALDANSDPFQFKFTLSMKDFDLFHYGVRGIELGIINEPGLEVDLSRNPLHFGAFAGAQASANLFRLRFGSMVELGLGQVGIGVDDQGHLILPTGAEADIHAGPFDINATVNGHMDIQNGTHNITFDSVTLGLKAKF